MDNIAEGYERNGNGKFRQFLYIAKGSCGEYMPFRHRFFGKIDISRFGIFVFELVNIGVNAP